MFWQTSRFRIDLSRPQVMGIVNVTPDSFSDGGHHATAVQALRHAEQLLAQGADLLDIGGESTRPGSPAVLLEDELARVLPVVREAVHLGVPVSVDTYKPEVMQAVLDLGADVINDIWSLRQPGAREVVARHPSCGVCLMHMHRDPQTMQVQPLEGDVIPAVNAFLRQELDRLLALGVAPERVVLDAGVGFGKTVEQNFALLARQSELALLGLPWLAGWSRKSSLGAVTQLPVEQRLVPSTTAAVLAVDRGARVVRVHDVQETRAALQVWQAVRDAEKPRIQQKA
ncbi:MAG: dihydropteroate synthase [Curvibacter lanceolatus]|jgi:dihydropteroate synthase|uniref:dihydropteroate synthase n=1 Tax=Curvibacter lanceolatus TaxID=86182 RepID=UPI000370719B|nr:dihydropteroate synthase [Curvibacter lanceolatus]MBV5292749.1 dihydropteroate synthase [Curvibacter lanceolatus]